MYLYYCIVQKFGRGFDVFDQAVKIKPVKFFRLVLRDRCMAIQQNLSVKYLEIQYLYPCQNFALYSKWHCDSSIKVKAKCTN